MSFIERFVCVCTCSLQELLLKAEGLPDGGAQLRRFRQAIVARMASMKNPVTEPSKEASAESVSVHCILMCTGSAGTSCMQPN